MDWFLYDNGLRHERVNSSIFLIKKIQSKLRLATSQPLVQKKNVRAGSAI